MGDDPRAGRGSLPRTLAPRAIDRAVTAVRGSGWRRTVALRRAAAAVLAVLALLLALWPAADPASTTAAVLVTAHDLAPGSTLSAADVEVRRWPVEAVPPAALHEPGQADGRVLAGAARAGEPLTDLRLAGPELARSAGGGADTTSVPIRLVDADVAALLQPGRTVDVVTTGPQADQPVTLAAGAIVLTVLPADKDAARRGRLVLVALPRSAATRVAGAALSQQVAVTLR